MEEENESSCEEKRRVRMVFAVYYQGSTAVRGFWYAVCWTLMATLSLWGGACTWHCQAKIFIAHFLWGYCARGRAFKKSIWHLFCTERPRVATHSFIFYQRPAYSTSLSVVALMEVRLFFQQPRKYQCAPPSVTFTSCPNSFCIGVPARFLSRWQARAASAEKCPQTDWHHCCDIPDHWIFKVAHIRF